MRTGHYALLAFGTIASTACVAADLFEHGPSSDPSLVIFYQDTSRVIAPDTVSSGAPFEVSFTTYGGGCSVIGGTDMTRTGAAVVLSPYDHDVDKLGCGRILRRMTHVTEVRIDAAGPWTIRVAGKRRDDTTAKSNQPAEITRQIFVR